MFKLLLSIVLIASSSAAYAENPRTLAQVLEALYGNSVNDPAPESLLGQYLHATGASTVTRRFLTAPKGNKHPVSEKGPARRVVGVSRDTFPEFQRLFSNKNMLYLFYAPMGSMVAYYQGKAGNYANLSQNLGFTSAGTMMIPIVLSDSEAERASNFFDLGRAPTLSQYAEQPWLLKDKDGRTYSAKTGFRGCTSWFTSIPIGDTLVDSYIFPSEDKDGLTPRQQPLVDYVTPAELSPAQEKHLRSVWTVPGHQQLGELLNPMASRRGEFTNVGWIAYSLLGSQGVDRVPLVFLFVDDVRSSISKKFPVKIYEY